jgi:zinc carboxypeptidase
MATVRETFRFDSNSSKSGRPSSSHHPERLTVTTRIPFICAAASIAVLVAASNPVRSDSKSSERSSAVVLGTATDPAAAASSAAGLGGLYAGPNAFVRDTNGDGISDAVVARVVAPATPSARDIESATNIAARLGYETTALSLPLILRDNDDQLEAIERPIFVGRNNAFVKKLDASGLISLKTLKPRQGLLALVRSPIGKSDAVVVAGADDEGTLAAAMELAARLPRLWTMTGGTVGGLETQTRTYLTSKGIATAGAVVHGLIVDADRLGLASVNIRADVSGGASRAIAALDEIDRAHSRGLEPRTLNLGNVAVIDVDVVVNGKSEGHALVHRSGMSPRLLTPPIDPSELAPDSPGQRGRASGPASVSSKNFDLAKGYSIDGWFGDSFADLIPDRTETVIVLGEGDETLGAAHIAARLGLESTGVTFPIAKPSAKVADPAQEPNPILIGRQNLLVDQLARLGRVRLDDLRAGDGVLQMVPKAFGAGTATVVAGGDATGTTVAAQYLARRVPYIWDTAPGALSYQDLVTEAGRFFQARSPAGQASQALDELDSIVRDLRGRQPESIESIDAKLLVDGADPQLAGYVAKALTSAFTGAKVSASAQATTDPVAVFEDQIDIPWEVDDFWAKLRTHVLPRIHAGAKVQIDAVLSESPQVRQTLETQVRAELTKAGATAATVQVLSAYKQGFLWITEQVLPGLKGKNVKSVRINAALHQPNLSAKYKFHTEPTRWLHELFPVDEVIQRELGISKDAVELSLVDHPKATYEIEALDAAGKVVTRAEFSPRVVEREYLEKFPGWAKVEVTTGSLRAVVDGEVVSDERIETDPETFWDYYQTKALPKIYDHVMKVTDGRPTPDKQPFHRDLDIEVWMSEPDFRIGIDEEQVSSIESLHEDLYFVTLDFFDAVGRTTTKRRLPAPGKILPIIHPDRAGQAGHARVLYAANAAANPRLEVAYREKGAARPTRLTRDLTRIETSAPAALRSVVRVDGVREVQLATTAVNDREALRAVAALESLARLHAAGMYMTSLSYDHIEQLEISVAAGDSQARRTLERTRTPSPSNVRRGGVPPTLPLMVWDHVVSPDESEDLVGQLAAYPEIKAYRAGTSYRGRPISVMEITAPTSSELVSRAKVTTYKPTIFITARQHANEMSSTGCVLRLAELIATDRGYKSLLQKVNVIVQPIENADGAQTSWELQKLTPNHMLHAGRYTSLGIDVGSQVDQPDPLLPEALVRGRVWRDWLPDIYLNLHGYPSHEWVQRFAGYVPPMFKGDWIPRGFHTTVRGLRDPRNTTDAAALEAIREAIVREVNSNADARDMDLRYQARYRRWAFGFAPFVYNQEIYKDSAIYYTDQESGEPLGNRRPGASPFGGAPATGRTMNAWPQVTFFSAVSETPDETAQGKRVELVTKPVFSYVMANIKYLRDGRYTVQRIGEDGQGDAVALTTLRVRPVLPGSARPAAPTSDR